MIDPSASATAEQPTPLRAWWLAIRPLTLPAAVGPVLVGLGAAVGTGSALRLDTAVACLLVALLLQVLANLSNDLSDFRRGTDTPDRAGPLRMAASGLISTRQLELAIAVTIGAVALVGLYLVWVGGPGLLIVGVAAIVAALAYTGGPLPYGYRGLGEVFVFLFFGLVAVVGTAYLQVLRLEPLFFAAALPVGSLVTAILVVNNLRDRPTDEAAGKRTLAVILGDRFARAEYVVLLAAAAVVPPALLVAGWSGPAALLPLAAFVLAVPLVREMTAVGPAYDRRRLNLVLKGTARLSMVYGALLALGLALGGAA